MKKILSILLCLFVIKSHGQVLLLKLNLNDCAKCQVMMSSYINSKFSSLPSFLVFPESMKDDSSDIKSRINDKYLNQNIIFSNYYYHLLDKFKASSIGYLSKSSKIECQISLSDINQEFSKKVDSIYENDEIVKTEFPIWTVIKGNKVIKFNQSLGNVKVTDSIGTIKYSIEDIQTQSSVKAVDKAYPHFYDFTLKNNGDEAEARFLKLKMGGFSLYGDDGYLIFRVPYKHLVTDSIMLKSMKGDSVRISYKYALAQKKRNGDVLYYPISVDNSIKDKKAYYILDLYGLQALNDTSFLVFYYPSDWKEHKEERQYIAMFKLRNGILQFEKQLKNKIPDIYIDAKIGYTFAASFECMDYPYYMPLMSSEIMNLENGVNYKFNLPNVDFKDVDTNYVKKVMSNEVECPIFNMGLFKDLKRNNLYLFSCIKKHYFLTVFDLNTLKVKSSTDLNDKGLSIKTETQPFSYVYFDKVKDAFLIEAKDDVLRSIPAQLLIPQ